MIDEVPNLRRSGAFHRLIDAIAYRIKGKAEDETCKHCIHVAELRTKLRVAQWLIGLAVTAALSSLFKSGCDAMAVRVSRVPSQSGSATTLVGTDDKKQP